ncbi:MAG: phosphoribosylanthranilate isomerase [Gemmatimonadota bacterium]|nr:phosphoribosylanthranilate isomerase [Gemmatimonadota bacterium]
MVRVKICGITNPQDALFAAAHGVDALGFIFYEPSPRYVRPERVSDIVSALPPFVTPVGVFVNAGREEILETARSTGIRAVQLHGDETPADCLGYPFPVIRAFRVGDGFDPASLNDYPVDTFLLDTAKKGWYGGTGETFDWRFARAATAHGRIILSGGMDPSNVAEAVRTVNPYAVDCGSGVEAAPGRKDRARIREFLEALRSANRHDQPV